MNLKHWSVMAKANVFFFPGPELLRTDSFLIQQTVSPQRTKTFFTKNKSLSFRLRHGQWLDMFNLPLICLIFELTEKILNCAGSWFLGSSPQCGGRFFFSERRHFTKPAHRVVIPSGCLFVYSTTQSEYKSPRWLPVSSKMQTFLKFSSKSENSS